MSEFRSTEGASVGTFRQMPVRYSPIEGLAIFEGDIVLGTLAQVQVAATAALGPKGIIIKGDPYRWPGGRVPYRIDPALPQQDRVLKAIQHWEAKTSIRFIALDGSTLNQYRDRVYFTSEGGCWSLVGRQGGEQKISLGDGCTAGNAIHEIGHTVGLWHEQSRADRDDFVTVIMQNVMAGMEHNFDQHINDGEDVEAYDYGSIMHYPPNAFSRNGQPTILAKQAGAVIGQREALSDVDVATVKKMYS
jgi:Astacin (Peptidase family M12A)